MNLTYGRNIKSLEFRIDSMFKDIDDLERETTL